MEDVEEVRMDWRFEIPLEFATITLRELRRFYEDGEKRFASEIAQLETKFKETSPEDTDFADYLCDVRDEREAILDLNREFAVIGIFRAFERFLHTFLDPQRHPGIAIPRAMGSRFEDLKKQYKGIGVDLTQPLFEWREIKKLHEVRNCIAHDDGWIDAKRAATLRSYRFTVKENDWIKLPQGYFLEAYNLIDRTCQLVIDRCRQVLKGTRP